MAIQNAIVTAYFSKLRKFEARGLCAFGLAALTAWAPLSAAPYQPRDDSEILERLPGGSFGRQARELRRLRRPTASQAELAPALALARQFIRKSRAEWDPRFLSYAQSALEPWWTAPQPPPPVLLLRATIEQSRHQFQSALIDLDHLLQRDPANAQAWLTRAAVLQVLGKFDEAKRCVLPLARLSPGLISITVAAELASLTGHAERGYELLSAALQRAAGESADVRIWALTVLAEMAERLGRPESAEAHFREALGVGVRNAYLLGAFSDFLLDHNRCAETAALLNNETGADGLLLRLALAEHALAPAASASLEHLEMLRARFASMRARGDSTHSREEARFWLSMMNDPNRALRLAAFNWGVQREPADARILLESALAANNAAAAAPALHWIEQTKIQDAILNHLAARLKSSSRRQEAHSSGGSLFCKGSAFPRI